MHRPICRPHRSQDARHIGLQHRSLLVVLLVLSTSSATSAGTSDEFVSASIEEDRLIVSLDATTIGEDFLFTAYPVNSLKYPPRIVRFEMIQDRLRVSEPEVRSPWGAIVQVEGQNSSQPLELEFRKIEEPDQFKVDMTEWLRLQSSSDLPPGSGSGVANTKVSSVANFENKVVLATNTANSDPEYGSNSIPGNTRKIWVLVKLPRVPMTPRLFDPMMAYNNQFGTQESASHYQPREAYTARYRIERDSPTQKSRAKKPIVFFLDPKVTERWREAVISGVLSWNTAFEELGIEGAIQVHDAPKNVSWDLFAAAHSVITIKRPQASAADLRDRWLGGTASWYADLRTGEILSSDIVINLPNEPIFVQYYKGCASQIVDEDYFDLTDAALDAMVFSTAAHEAGHALGLRDGNYGKGRYETKMLRDKTWLKSMGYTPSVMNYSRCNYVAQPEDDIPEELLFRKIGPADHHQIRWGYSYDIESLPSQLEFQKELVGEQMEKPWLEFLPTRGNLLIGPQTPFETVATDNPVEAAYFGMRSLQRDAALLQTAARSGYYDTSLVIHARRVLVGNWFDQLKHVSSLIGGFHLKRVGAEFGDLRTMPISVARQKEATEYLLRELANPPSWFWQATGTRQTQFESWPLESRQYGEWVLSTLLAKDRLARLMDHADSFGEWGASTYFQIIEKSIMNLGEVEKAVENSYWMAMQSHFVGCLVSLTAPAEVRSRRVSSELRAEANKTLSRIKQRLSDSMNTVDDGDTKAHYRTLVDIIRTKQNQNCGALIP